MASQLRRMLLVNTKTSGASASQSINELDPRGGAAITGENSVGKTTTLQLIPLFFGTLPNHIVEALGQREPMLDYVLPQPQSAIVFEYQRGNDEANDVRCVILRRHADGGPRYRFFAGAFDEAHFTLTLPDGKNAFCDDSQMVDAMNAAGSPASGQYGIADYRYVILGQRANKENFRKLREACARYSFATRSLTNLDRLIESVVKEQVAFKDFIQLASTIVQERMGGVREATQKGKLALKQSRAQIEQWLADREACERAFDLEPKVAQLRGNIEAYHNISTNLAEAKHQVAPLYDDVAAKLDEAEVDIKVLRGLHATMAEELEQDLARLESDVAQARQAKTTSAQAVQIEIARRESLELDVIAQWEQDLATLADRSRRLSLLAREIKTATGKSDNIDAEYQELIRLANANFNEEIARINEDAKGPQETLDAEHAAAERWAGDRLQALETEHGAQTDDLAERLVIASGALQVASEGAKHAQASEDVLDALEAARLEQKNHGAALLTATTDEGSARADFKDKETAFAEAQRALGAARKREGAALERVAAANLLLKPQDGSLLATLRAHPGEEWKMDLARVLDPALLGRTDLSPRFDTESDHTVYGLNLDTLAIDVPQWTDDARLRLDLESAQNLSADAKDGVEKCLANQAEAESKFGAAQAAHQKAVRMLAAAKGLSEGRQAAVDIAIDQVNQSKVSARRASESDAARLRKEVDLLRSQKGALARQQANEREAIRVEATRQKTEAKGRFDRSKQALAKRETDARSANDDKVKDLREQCNQALSAEGVDVNRLDNLRKQHATDAARIDEIERHLPVVNRWKAWLDEGGHSILSTLEASLADENTALEKALRAHMQREEEGKIERGKVSDKIAGANIRAQDLRDNLGILNELKVRHGIPNRSPRQLSAGLTPEGLQGNINNLLSRQTGAQDTIRIEFSKLSNDLTARQSAVKDLFENSLASTQEIEVVPRATSLCEVHRLVAREVLPNVINSAESIVDHIRQFRQRIQTFEREVKAFNGQFQEGLDRMSGFKRIRDFKVQIATDFSKVNFLKSLDLVDEVGRDQAFERSSNETPVLPSAQTAQALRNFSSLLKETSTLEIELGRHITLRGSATVNDVVKPFSNEVDLQNIASTGLNAIILITLLSGMLNMIRGNEEVHIPWVTDEAGKFDPGNLKNLMEILRENHIDIVTASPKLTIAEFRCFNNRYIFRDRGSIARYADPVRRFTASDIQEPA